MPTGDSSTSWLTRRDNNTPAYVLLGMAILSIIGAISVFTHVRGHEYVPNVPSRCIVAKHRDHYDNFASFECQRYYDIKSAAEFEKRHPR